MLELSQVNCCPGSILSYSAVNFVEPSLFKSSMWPDKSDIGMGGWDSMPGVWKFILRISTGSDGAIMLAFCISKPDMSGVITWPESIGCLMGWRRRLNMMTMTTMMARPMPATTGPTTQSKLFRRGSGRMLLQLFRSSHGGSLAGGRVAEGMYGSEKI